MRNYWIAFILIISAGFAALGLIVFKGLIQKPQPVLVYLNLDSMKTVAGHITDSAGLRPAIVSIFPCEQKNSGKEITPWADLYVCRSYSKSDSLSGDTALLLIDVHTKRGLLDIKDIDHYGVDIKTAQRFKTCRVMIPPGQIDNIRKYRYKFVTTTLVDDWVSE